MPTLSPLPHGAGHGFISEHQWAEVQSACGEEFKKPGKPAYSAQCQARLAEASDAAGKFYVYDIYDTCAGDQLKQSMDAKAHAGGAEPLNVTLSRSHTTGTLQQLQKTYALGAAGGGPRGEPAYSPYGCGKNAVTQHWLNLPGAPVGRGRRPVPPPTPYWGQSRAGEGAREASRSRVCGSVQRRL